MTDYRSTEHSASAHNLRTIRAAIRAFRKHELIEGDENSRRWRIARRYDDGSVMGQYASEVVSLWGGRLYAGGDISECVFAYYSDTNDGHPEHHRHKLCWIGRGQDVCYYIHQKATIGIGCNGKLTSTWDDDVARHELQELLDDEDQEWSDEEREAIEYAQSLCSDGEEWVIHHLYENIRDPYDLPNNLGKVVSTRVIYAWAACRKVCQLLWGPAKDDRFAEFEKEDENGDS